MNTPKIKISLVSNTSIKQMYFENKGDIHAGHKHTFDHQTLVGAGAVKVTVEGKTSEFKAPAIIFVRAGLQHEIEAIENNTVCYCIHAIRDGERIQDIIDPEDIPETGIETNVLEGISGFIVPTKKQYIE